MRFYPKNLFTNRQHHGACGPAPGSELALPVAGCEPAPELSGFCAAGPLSCSHAVRFCSLAFGPTYTYSYEYRPAMPCMVASLFANRHGQRRGAA